jgi:Holliday junction resolvase RusA-like endonuclease
MKFRGGEGTDAGGQGGGAVQAAPPPIILTVPLPPSVNRMFRDSSKGRAKSKAYQDWLGHAGWVLRLQRPGSIHGRVLVIVSAEQAGAGSDIDNRIKALFDLLVAHKVIDDDSMIVGFCAAWAPACNRQARVMIIPAAPMDIKFMLAGDGAHGGFFLQAPEEDQSYGDFTEFSQEDVG